MPDKILEIENISIAYDNKVVMQNFSLQLNKGEHIAVVGASGCGKSSMLRAILGFIPLAQGKILYKGTEISNSNIYNIRAIFASVSI